jgi:hypothetical protein
MSFLDPSTLSLIFGDHVSQLVVNAATYTLADYESMLRDSILGASGTTGTDLCLLSAAY